MHKANSENSQNVKLNIVNEEIHKHIPLMIKILSQELNRYIEVENDEYFSLGLLAIEEALNKYEPNKGKFSVFLKLILLSRLKDFWRKESKNEVIYIENYDDVGYQVKTNEKEEESLRVEILSLKEELKRFNISFDVLVEKSPKHKDTRVKAISLGKKISTNNPMVMFLYSKLRLPIVKVVETFNVTKKFIKSHKLFITTIVVIYKEKYELIKGWLHGVN